MQERARGCLLGLAVGDALGTTLEFKAPGTFKPIEDMVGGGPFHLYGRKLLLTSHPCASNGLCSSYTWGD